MGSGGTAPGRCQRDDDLRPRADGEQPAPGSDRPGAERGGGRVGGTGHDRQARRKAQRTRRPPDDVVRRPDRRQQREVDVEQLAHLRRPSGCRGRPRAASRWRRWGPRRRRPARRSRRATSPWAGTAATACHDPDRLRPRDERQQGPGHPRRERVRQPCPDGGRRHPQPLDLRRGAGVRPEQGGPLGGAVGAEQDEPVHLAGDPDAAQRAGGPGTAGEEFGDGVRNRLGPAGRLGLGRAGSWRPDRIRTGGVGEHAQLVIDERCLHRPRTEVEGENAHQSPVLPDLTWGERPRHGACRRLRGPPPDARSGYRRGRHPSGRAPARPARRGDLGLAASGDSGGVTTRPVRR